MRAACIFLASLLLTASARAQQVLPPPPLSVNLNNAWTGMQAFNGGTTQTTAAGSLYDGANNPDVVGTALFTNLLQANYNSVSPTTYPAGAWGSGFIVSTNQTNGTVGTYGSATNNYPGGGFALGGLFSAYQGVNGAGDNFGFNAYGYSLAGATSGETAAGFFAIVNACDPANGCNPHGMEVLAYQGIYTARNGIQLTNANANGSPAAFETGIHFQNNNISHLLVSFAYISDATITGGLNPGLAPYGVYWKETSFSAAEYLGPSFEIGPTVASYNARIEVTGAASGGPTVAAVGAGTTPATAAPLNLMGLGGNPVSVKTPLQLPVYTVASLPTCNAALANSEAAVSDASAPSYNGALTGSGGVHVPVFCNGSTWAAH